MRLPSLPAADRKQELDDLLKILPPTNTRITGRISAKDKSWEDWVRRTGELPPDFDAMPSVPELPEPRLSTREEWPRERQRIRALFEQWFYGKMPPAPDNLRSRSYRERTTRAASRCATCAWSSGRNTAPCCGSN